MSNKSFKCDQCSMLFNHLSSLSRHKKQKHASLSSSLTPNLSFEVTDAVSVAMEDFRNGKLTQEEFILCMRNPKSISCCPTMDIGYILKGSASLPKSSNEASRRIEIYEYVKDQLIEADCFDVVKSYLKEKDYAGAFKVAFNKQIFYEDEQCQYLAEGQLVNIQISQEFLVGMGDTLGLLMIIINTVEYDLLTEMQTMIKKGADIESIIGPSGITKQIDDLKLPLYGNANKHRAFETILEVLDDFSISLNL